MVKVASYNIRKSVGTDWRRRPDRVLAVLAEIDADIIALQEVDRRFGERASSLSPERIRHDTPYEAVPFGGLPRSLGWHGNAILVREGIEVLDHHRLILPALEPRGAVLADLRVGDRLVRVVGMHLGLLGLWRLRQAHSVLAALESLETHLPTVMMGDLNEWTTRRGCLLPFSEHHRVLAPGPSFPSKRPFATFDRIITSPEIAVEGAGVHASDRARTASDHLPVWASLTPPPTAAPCEPAAAAEKVW